MPIPLIPFHEHWQGSINQLVECNLQQFFVLPFCDREQSSSALFFQYNTQLGPPYYILVDTNFINFSIKNKLEIVKSMMDCLYAKCKSTVPSFLEWEQQKRNNVFLSMKKKKKTTLQSLYSRSKSNRKYRSRPQLVKAINFQHQFERVEK